MKSIALFLCFLVAVVCAIPTKRPTSLPTPRPTSHPTKRPTSRPTIKLPKSPPTLHPTSHPTKHPTKQPTNKAPAQATLPRTKEPTRSPASPPLKVPTLSPALVPVSFPISFPTDPSHSIHPSHAPTEVRHAPAPFTIKPTFLPAKCSLAVAVKCTLGGSTLDCNQVYSVVTASNCSNALFKFHYNVTNTGTTLAQVNSMIGGSLTNVASQVKPNPLPAGRVSTITELFMVNVCDKVAIKFPLSASAQVSPNGLSCSASAPFALTLRAPSWMPTKKPTRVPTARPSQSIQPSTFPSRSYLPSRLPSTSPSTSHFPSLPPTCNDTVWAVADSTASQCFLQSASNVNQRGWTNLINGIGTTNLTLYAATGGCDTTDRTRLGNATVVTRSAGSNYFVTITLKAANRVYLTKAYLYAGQTFLPKNAQGSFTTASSAFTVKFEPTRFFQSYTNNITVTATLPFYVAVRLEAKYIC